MNSFKLSKNAKGFVLATVLILCGLVFFLLFYTSPSRLNFDMIKENILRQLAMDASYGSHDYSIAEIIYNPEWDNDYKDLDIQYGIADGKVRFIKKNEKNLDYYSTNNYGNFDSTTGWNGRKIPPGFVHVVSRGQGDNLKASREALMNPYYRLYYEPFDQMNGSAPKNQWYYKNSSYSIKDYFLFMGNLKPVNPTPEFVVTGDLRWKDYDFISEVAYYGNTEGSNGFGMMFRYDGNVGYGFLIVPRIDRETITGADIFLSKINGDDWEPIGSPTAVVDGPDWQGHNPFYWENYTNSPALWALQVSVEAETETKGKTRTEKQYAWFSVAAIDKSEKTYTLKKVTDKLDLSQGGDIIKNGAIGFFAEEMGTEIGITNVVVNKRGLAEIRVVSEW